MKEASTGIVVITGGARGIGYGLARAFLDRGCRVVISGRSEKTIQDALSLLSLAAGADHVDGAVCDVRDFESVRRLWDFSIRRFGGVDIWINNAGVGQPQTAIEQLDPARIGEIFATNCAGALFGYKVALEGMRAQGRGAIYNMEGLGSKGGLIKGMSAYGASKRALAYLTDSMAREAAGSPVIVGALMSGMTVTDLITREYLGKPEEWAKVRRIFNILSDTVDTIAPWLVEKMLGNTRNGRRIVWLTGGKAALRFLRAPFSKRSVYKELP